MHAAHKLPHTANSESILKPRTTSAEFKGVRVCAPVSNKKCRRRVFTREAISKHARVEGARW